jgi:integrase
MARKSSVSYWPSRSAYGCWFHGQQHILAAGPDDQPGGPTYRDAIQRFAEIVDLENAGDAGDRNTVRTVFEKYLAHIHGKAKPATFALRSRYLCDFLADSGRGDVMVRDLAGIHVYDFIERRRRSRWVKKANRDCRWGDGAARALISSLKAAFSWAVRVKLVSTDPVASLVEPEVRSRGRDCVLTGAQHAVIVAHCRSTLRDVVVVLENTGARPAEVVNASAAAFDADLGALIYHTETRRRRGEYSHKSATRGKDRVVLLTGEALAVVRRLAATHPIGELFRNTRGRRWTRSRLVSAFKELRCKAKMPSAFTAYSYRHTFATRWLEDGGSIDVLAELMGNTPETIRKHYAHLFNDRRELRAKLEAFRAAGRSDNRQLRVAGE